MSEIVNLRRVRKAKARADAAAQADSSRIRHGTPKHERNLATVRAQKQRHAVDVHKLDHKE